MNLLLAAAHLFIIMFGIKATAVVPLPTKLRQQGVSGRLALLLTILALLESFEVTQGMVTLVRPSTGSTSAADAAEKQKARQLLGSWWERGKSMINPKL